MQKASNQIPDWVYQPVQPDATKVVPPLQWIPPEIYMGQTPELTTLERFGQEPSLSQTPEAGGFAIKNVESAYWDMTPEQQKNYRLQQKYGLGLDAAPTGPEVASPTEPYGNTMGALIELARGLGLPGRGEVKGSDPTINEIANFVGGGVKYVALYKTVASAAVKLGIPVAEDVIGKIIGGMITDYGVGAISGLIRTGGKPDQSVSDEALMAMVGGVAIRVVPDLVSSIKLEPGKLPNDVTPAPKYPLDMTGDEYVYHNSASRHLESIRKEGLSKNYAGEYPHGYIDVPDEKLRIYFGESPEKIKDFGGSALLRVKKSVIQDNVMSVDMGLRGKETWYFGNRVSPENIEIKTQSGWESLIKSSDLVEKQIYNGARYDGVQEMPKGKPSKLVFTDTESGSTFMVDTPDQLPAKVAEVRQKFIANFFGYNPEVAKSLQKAWSGTVDKVAYEALSVVPQKVKDFTQRFFYGDAPPGVRVILAQARLGKVAGQREAVALAEQLSVIPKGQREEVYKFIDPKLMGEGSVAPEYRDIVRRAMDRIEELGNEAVNLGLLSEETYKANLREYLGRYYQGGNSSWNEFLQRPFKQMAIKGERFKSRTLTGEQAVAHGVITDPSYAVARTVQDLTFDIETAKAFRRIAENVTWAKASEAFADATQARQAGFVRVPKDKRFGDLADKWVDRSVSDEVFSLVHPSSGSATKDAMAGIYDKMLGYWKLGKTAWNPATHFRNIFSNFILADIGAGLSPVRVDIYANALRQYIKKGPLYEEAAKTGLFGTDWFGSEVRAFINPENVAGSSSMFDALNRSLTSRIMKAPGNLYQGEEHWFKMAVYLNERAGGATIEQAAAHAQKYLFDYSDISPMLQKMRGAWWGGPFLTFTSKALPIMVESAVKNPIRFWKYPVMMKGLHEYSKAKLGISEDEWKKMESVLPPWKQNGWNVLLPARGREGKPRLLDLTYNMPWGQLGESPSLLKNVPILKDLPFGAIDPFIGSNPFTNLAANVVFNRDRFLDKPIYSPNIDTPLEGVGKIMVNAGYQLTPGFIPAGIATYKALAEKPGEYGDISDKWSTISNKILGIKISDVDTQKGLQIAVGKLRDVADELRSAAYKLRARRERGGITKEEFSSDSTRLIEIEGQLMQREQELKQLEQSMSDTTVVNPPNMKMIPTHIYK